MQITTTTTTTAAGFGLVRRSGTALTGAGLLLGALTACGGAGSQALALELPSSDVAQMCAELSPGTMAKAEIAFKGEVTAISGDVVTLEVQERYTGQVPEEVTIPQQPEGQPSELSIGALREGQEYLISAQEDHILTCGQSGPATDELTALYEAAYQQ